jgi:hypothetical protein
MKLSQRIPDHRGCAEQPARRSRAREEVSVVLIFYDQYKQNPGRGSLYDSLYSTVVDWSDLFGW